MQRNFEEAFSWIWLRQHESQRRLGSHVERIRPLTDSQATRYIEGTLLRCPLVVVVSASRVAWDKEIARLKPIGNEGAACFHDEGEEADKSWLEKKNGHPISDEVNPYQIFKDLRSLVVQNPDISPKEPRAEEVCTWLTKGKNSFDHGKKALILSRIQISIFLSYVFCWTPQCLMNLKGLSGFKRW